MRALLPLLALSLPTSALAEEEVRRFALLVGANDGGEGRVALRYAHDDAEAVRDVLLDLGGVSPGDELLLQEPDRAALDAAFTDLADRLAAAGDQAEVLFYYSGHSDEEGLLLAEDRYGYRDLRARLDDLPARVRIAVLDSCASGALIRAKGGTAVAPFLVDESTRVDGVAYITSSSSDEVAQEADGVGGSYFTHALTTGLRGAADVDDDGRVTLHEAYRFAFDETLARTERSQHGPQHANYDFQLSGSGDLVLTDLQRTDATLALDAAIVGRALVRDRDGRLLAELTKPRDRGVELGLPEGPYVVTVATDDGRYGTAEILLYAGESTPLPAAALQWREGDAAVARKGSDPEPAAVDGADVAGPSPVGPTEIPIEELVRAEIFPGLPPSDQARDTILLGAAWAESPDLVGVGVATLGTSARSLDGAQLGLFWSIADEGRGLQTAWGFTRSRGDFGGLQLAPVNLLDGAGNGAQLGGLNRAAHLDGTQLGLLNVGGRVRGAQIGLVNVAREVDGVQLGLLNVADDVRGTPLGLLSLERDGHHDLVVYAEDVDLANLELQLGGDWLYTILGGGATPGRHAELHAGLGVHVPMGPVWLGLASVTAAYGDVADLGGRAPTVITSGRATLGLGLLEALQPFAGVTVNVPIAADATSPLAVGPDGASAWPGVLAGIAMRPNVRRAASDGT